MDSDMIWDGLQVSLSPRCTLRMERFNEMGKKMEKRKWSYLVEIIETNVLVVKDRLT